MSEPIYRIQESLGRFRVQRRFLGCLWLTESWRAKTCFRTKETAEMVVRLLRRKERWEARGRRRQWRSV